MQEGSPFSPQSFTQKGEPQKELNWIIERHRHYKFSMCIFEKLFWNPIFSLNREPNEIVRGLSNGYMGLTLIQVKWTIFITILKVISVFLLAQALHHPSLQ